MKKVLITVIQGFFMGVAEIIPGVSGSTIALVLGIYEKFIEILYSVSEIAKEFFRFLMGKSKLSNIISKIKDIDWKFAIPLFVGMILAITSLAQFLHLWLELKPQNVYAWFLGLTLMTLSVPWNEIKNRTSKSYWIVLISTIFFIIVFSVNPLKEIQNPSLVYVFIGGAIAISAMILPGISGSFLLVVLGLYQYILSLIESLLNFNFEALISFGVFLMGILTGFSLFVRFLKKALKYYNDELMAFLTGILIASIRILWPFFELEGSDKIYLSPFEMPVIKLLEISIFFGIGIFLISFLKYLSNKI